MKTTTFRSMALALGLGLTTAAAAQPIVIEAEDPIDQFEAKMADFSAEGSEASGGAGMGLDNAHHGAFLQYAFEVPSAGTYDLKIFYVTLNTRWLSVKINDQVANVVRFTDFTGNWNGVPGEVLDEESGEMIARPGVASKTIQVYCEEGENFLRIDALYGYSPEDGRDLPFSPSIDKFELTKSATEIAKPEDWTAEGNQIKQEFEDFTTASGQGKVQNLGGLTGAAIGQGGGTLSYDVNVPEEGVYKLNIWFATAQRRWVTVKVNEQVPAYVGFLQGSDSWGNDPGDYIAQRQVLVYLKQGKNTIIFGQYTKTGKDASEHGDSPNLDYFTLDLVNYPDMQEPEREISAYKAALSDIATWESTLDGVINDHNEFTVGTSSSNDATVTLKFPYPILMTGYAYATENNSDQWTVEVSADGQAWKQASTPTSKSATGLITTAILEDPYADVASNLISYVRLNIAGDQAASLGEFNVFGNPYVSETAQNPAGLLPQDGSFTDYESTHQGFDVDSWHEGIDKLFDGQNNTQFTVTNEGDGAMGDADDIVIDMYLPSEVVVGSYMLSTHYSAGYYNERSPKAWALQAFDYGTEGWVDIDSRENMSFVTPGSTLPMTVKDNAISTESYKLIIKNRRNMATHLSGLQLFEATQSGIDNIATDKVNALMIAGIEGAVVIASGEVAPYAIYTVSGVQVAGGETGVGDTTISLPNGLYLVKVGEHVAKVIVK